MTAIRTAGHDTTVKIQSLLPARLPHLKSPDAATAAARTPGQSHAIISTHRFPAGPWDQPCAMFAVRVAVIPSASSQRARQGTGTRCRAAYSTTIELA